jgi:DNA-directed RNA polymerase specialized sigma24 family protein
MRRATIPRAIASSRHSYLKAAVRRLPLTYRQAVTLALEGLTPKEIVDFLGLTPNAAAIRFSRAKDDLREQIGDSP